MVLDSEFFDYQPKKMILVSQYLEGDNIFKIYLKQCVKNIEIIGFNGILLIMTEKLE
jgi:hypothetical protein